MEKKYSNERVAQLARDLAFEGKSCTKTAGRLFCTDVDTYNAMLADLFGAVPGSRTGASAGGTDQDRVLKEQLRKLTVRQRLIVECHYGLWSYPIAPEETAEALGISLPLYSAEFDKARTKLRKGRDRWLTDTAFAVRPPEAI